jgi:hypothetical protein
MTSDPRSKDQDSPIETALDMAASSDWSDRAAAVRLLARHIGDQRARAQLLLSMSDVDTAVVEIATDALVRVGGIEGMRAALRQLTLSEDDVGYHIRDTLVHIWMDGYPVLDVVNEILRDEPPGAAHEGALEMVDLLNAR